MEPTTPFPDQASLELAARRVRWRIRAVEAAAVVVWLAASAAVSLWPMPPWARILIAFSPTPALLWCALTFWRGRKHLDEFGRQVILEGAAFGFAALIAGLLVYAMIEHAGIGIPEAGWPLAFAYAAIAFAVGIWLSLRRRGSP
jgi:hypothetical protein